MIKLFVCDVDGTLTDGIYHTTEGGEISKNFFTRDFHGLWMLNEAGVKICIITAAGDDVIKHQCRRGAKYVTVLKGVRNKLFEIEEMFVKSGLFLWNEIAYIGDDVFDIDLLYEVGLASCPSDADAVVLEILEDCNNADRLGEVFVSRFPGGKGCVREFADYVLDANKQR